MEKIRMKRAIALCFAAPLVVLGCSYDFDQFARGAPTISADGSAGSGGTSAASGGAGGLDAQSGGAGGLGAQSGGASGLDAQSGGAGGLDAQSGGAGGLDGASAEADSDGPSTGGAAGTVTDASGEDESNAIVDAASDASLDTGTGYCDAVQGTVFLGHCYYVNKAKAKWNGALCTTVPGFHLVTITSAAEQAAVTSIINPVDLQDYWMGLAEPAGTYAQKKEANFEWVTAPAEHYDPATSYRHWYSWTDADHEPNFAPTPTGGCTPIDCWPDCVRVRSTGDWSDGPCGDALWSICEHD
jgi:hypothetical protein